MAEDFREPIEALLDRLGRTYKLYRGGQAYQTRCLSPDHPDHHPSMLFYFDSGFTHCFSCGFHKHVSVIAREMGVDGDGEITSMSAQFNREQAVSLKERLEKREAQRPDVELPLHYEQFDSEIPELKLGLDVIRKFNIGSCSNGFNGVKDVQKCQGCRYEHGLESGDGPTICYFTTRRVLTPIESRGILYSIESRKLKDNPSEKKVLYPFGSKPSLVVFNQDNLDPRQPLYIVEGIKSALRIHQTVSQNVTAVFSNQLKGKQPDILRGFPIKMVIPDLGDAGEVLGFQIMEIDPGVQVGTLPLKIVCRSCGSLSPGKEGGVCSTCGGRDTKWADAFDLEDSELKRVASNPNERWILDLVERYGVILNSSTSAAQIKARGALLQSENQ